MEHTETIIIGGGQAGLSMGYHLQQRGRSFVILDANDRVGEAWRSRWDSLRLFTPARFDGLDGLPFPGPKHAAPTKDEFADYLESYAEHFNLPIRKGVKVDRLTKRGERFVVSAGEQSFSADNVILATGTHQIPKVPGFAGQVDPSINQLHASTYKGPHQLADGDVLIVGVGNSGADICLDVVRTHKTFIAGKEPGKIPFRPDTKVGHRLVPVVRFLGMNVITRGTKIGRKVGPKIVSKGNPLVRVKPKDIVAAGVERVGRVTGVRDGLPVVDDGRTLDVANIIWCTGFRSDYSWIDLPLTGDSGEPIHDRGIAEHIPGLYFLGLLFQYSLTSDVITGVGRDAAFIADHLVASRASAKVG